MFIKIKITPKTKTFNLLFWYFLADLWPECDTYVGILEGFFSSNFIKCIIIIFYNNLNLKN